MLVSEITAFLEDAFDILNAKYFNSELPRAVITVQSSPRAYAHYTTYDAWKENNQGYREINLGAENLSRQITEIIASLLHECVHFYCDLNGIKDVSRGGTYHNKNFKIEAEKRDLIIEYSSRIGHSITSPSDNLIQFVKEQGWENIDLSRSGESFSFGGNSTGGIEGGLNGSTGKKSSTRKYICPVCGCSVRATKVVNIGCLDCDTKMEVVEK